MMTKMVYAGVDLASSVESVQTYVVATKEMLADARGMQDWMKEAFRRMDLEARGFLGLIRCDRCRRATRSVYVVPAVPGDFFHQRDLYYGRSCYRIVMAGEERYRIVERICHVCGRSDAGYEAFGKFYCDDCNDG